MLVSPSGVVESVSGSLSRVLGHDPEYVENRPLAELVREDDRSALEAALKCATQGATAANPVTAPVRLLRYASATTVPFELALVNLLDDPTVEAIVVSAHDVTEREAAELELHKALSLLNSHLDLPPMASLPSTRRGTSLTSIADLSRCGSYLILFRQPMRLGCRS